MLESSSAKELIWIDTNVLIDEKYFKLYSLFPDWIFLQSKKNLQNNITYLFQRTSYLCKVSL